MNHEDVSAEIKISPWNSMKATYSIVGVGSSDTLAEIEARLKDSSIIGTDISIRVKDNDVKEVELRVIYPDVSEVLAEIQPVGHNNVSAEIDVREGNRMWALFDVEEPPRLFKIIYPEKDSFVRTKNELRSINYGENNSLAVGGTSTDGYDSYIKFNLSAWNKQYRIISAKLRLHYSRNHPTDRNLKFATLAKNWNEIGITDLNKPNDIKAIFDEFEVNSKERYIDVDFTKITNEWVKDYAINNGFSIKLDDNKESLLTFEARESQRPPELIVEYYDARVYSAGRSQTLAELFVWNIGDSGTLAEIDVSSVIGNSDVEAELYIHRREAPVFDSTEAEITVNRKSTQAEITVSIRDEYITPAEITARSGFIPSNIKTEVTASKPFQLAEIYVSNLSQPETEITIQRNPDNDIGAEITVTREFTNAYIFVKYRDNIDSEITVQLDRDNDIGAEITVTREFTEVEITPRIQDISVKTSEIFIRAINDSNIETDIVVSRKIVYAELTVTNYKDIDAEIYIKYRDSIETEIVVTIFDDVLAEIDIVASSLIESEITSSKPIIHAEITVPFWDDSDVLTEIDSRVIRVSDVETVLAVRIKGGSYAFII